MRPELISTFREAARQMRSQYPVVFPAGCLLLLTLVCWTSSLDLTISGWFFDQSSKSWIWKNHNPWAFIDEYFVLPGMILGLLAIPISFYGAVKNHWTPLTKAGLLLTWVLLIGPGLMVNGTWKPFFSRPRPREVVELGGPEPYCAAFGFGRRTHQNSSFPSGHASIGFFLIAPAFLFRKQKAWRWSLFLAGFTYGSLMSLSRIVQGAHYFSDVIWSLGIVYFTAWFLATMLLTAELFLSSDTIAFPDQADTTQSTKVAA